MKKVRENDEGIVVEMGLGIDEHSFRHQELVYTVTEAKNVTLSIHATSASDLLLKPFCLWLCPSIR